MTGSSTMQNVSQLHKLHHDDYDQAKAEIHQALGSIADIEIFGSQILVACYIRPTTIGGKAGSLHAQTTKGQTEDAYLGKALLVLKCGPDAFKGDDSYVKAMFGDLGAPIPGDWVFARPQDGTSIQLCGDGASRPQGKDFKGEPIDLFDWDGWPCRIMDHAALIGRINKPHHIV